jgi:predicted ribosome quality control (RQC) complex YloA/Tae2 family protein
MNYRAPESQEKRLEEILFSSTDPVSKVQQIIRLGFDPEVADEIVERHQIGTQSPTVYYERLDFADLDDEPELTEPLADPEQPHQVEQPHQKEADHQAKDESSTKQHRTE